MLNSNAIYDINQSPALTMPTASAHPPLLKVNSELFSLNTPTPDSIRNPGSSSAFRFPLVHEPQGSLSSDDVLLTPNLLSTPRLPLDSPSRYLRMRKRSTTSIFPVASNQNTSTIASATENNKQNNSEFTAAMKPPPTPPPPVLLSTATAAIVTPVEIKIEMMPPIPTIKPEPMDHSTRTANEEGEGAEEDLAEMNSTFQVTLIHFKIFFPKFFLT